MYSNRAYNIILYRFITSRRRFLTMACYATCYYAGISARVFPYLSTYRLQTPRQACSVAPFPCEHADGYECLNIIQTPITGRPFRVRLRLDSEATCALQHRGACQWNAFAKLSATAIHPVWRLALSSYLRPQLAVLRVDDANAAFECFINSICFVLLHCSPQRTI